MQRIRANSLLGDNLALLQIRCWVVPTYRNLTPNPNSKPYPNPKRFDNKINNAGTTLPRVRNGRVVQGSELARLPCSNSKVIGLLVSHYMLKLKKYCNQKFNFISHLSRLSSSIYPLTAVERCSPGCQGHWRGGDLLTGSKMLPWWHWEAASSSGRVRRRSLPHLAARWMHCLTAGIASLSHFRLL